MQKSFSIVFLFILKNLHTIEGQGEQHMENRRDVEKDILEVERILKEEVGLSTRHDNQIRLFLNGNEKSHLYLKCAFKYALLWGKYPTLTIQEIKKVFKDPIPSMYAVFENIENAKKFTVEDLESLTDWNVNPEQTKVTKVYHQEVIEGRLVSFHSKPEYRTYSQLKDLGVITSFRSQSLMIPYATYRKTIHRYFPDFIFLTPDGYIAIVESKPTPLMSTFMVRAKYEALKDYCEKHGFIYAMMDEQLQTFSAIHSFKEENEITRFMEEIKDTARLFNDFALKLLYDKFKHYTQKAIKEIISRYVIQQDYYNPSTYGFKLTQQRFSARRLKKHLLMKDNNHHEIER
jgi:hypothetical protein